MGEFTHWYVPIFSYIVKLAVCKNAQLILSCLLGSSTSCKPVSQSAADLVVPSSRHDLLVPHISQNASASGDCLLLPASSACGSVVVCRAALHLCDFAEPRGVGLPCDNVVSEKVRTWELVPNVRLVWTYGTTVAAILGATLLGVY